MNKSIKECIRIIEGIYKENPEYDDMLKEGLNMIVNKIDEFEKNNRKYIKGGVYNNTGNKVI